MATLEQVEKLRERASVSYDEAKAALELCGDDLLEALIYLEQNGKVASPSGGGTYSTQQEAPPFGRNNSGPSPYQEDHTSRFKQSMQGLWRWICNLVAKGNSNHFEVWRLGSCFMSLPVTVLVLVTAFGFWAVLPLLIIGMFLGCSYKFRGPELDNSAVNNVMDAAAHAADSLKNEVLHPDDPKQ